MDDVPFWLSYVLLCAVQGLAVALPRPLALPPRLRGRGWALVPVASIVITIIAISATSGAADVATYLALVFSPPMAWWALTRLRVDALAAAASVIVALALAWVRFGIVSEAAATALTVLGCVTLGTLLAAVAPARWLKAGIVAMAIADTYLVVSDLLQAPNATLNAAAPVFHLPQLQRVLLGSALMGYGDMFLAAVLGGVVARNRPVQRGGALLTGVLAAAFGLLFFAVDELPATVPVAVTLILLELRARRRVAPSSPDPTPRRSLNAPRPRRRRAHRPR
jgi:hypothetical protein